MSPISEAHQRATNKWNKENYDRIQLVVDKGMRDAIKDRAASLGLSVNAYIKGLITADLAGVTPAGGVLEGTAGVEVSQVSSRNQ